MSAFTVCMTVLLTALLALPAAHAQAVSGPVTVAPIINTIAGNGANGYANGAATTVAEMSQINGVAVDNQGNVYIADGQGSNNAIRMVPAMSGTYFGQAMTAGNMYTIAGNNTQGYSGDGSLATNAELDNPGEVTVDGQGNVYFSDVFNNRVRMVAAVNGTYFGQTMTAGYIYTIAGGGSSTKSGAQATNAALNNPKGVALDSAGNLYITEIKNNDVRMVPAVSGTYFGQTMTANYIYTIAGNGTAGYINQFISK
ncbi:MAG: hypothetical protein ACP5EP_07855 [Acidobacteriaceae bacterium]